MTIELTEVASGYSTGVINSNFEAVEAYINDNLLNRDGTSLGESNQMEVNLDMNSHFVYNLPEPVLEHQAARLKDVQNALSDNAANLITFTPYGNITSENVQGALQELVDGTGQAVTTSTGNQTLVDSLNTRVSRQDSTLYISIPTDYSTISDALEAVSKLRLVLNTEAVINLETGFVMSEQVFIDDIDLAFVRITSTDAEVVIDRSSLTVAADIWAFGDRFPAFLGTRGAKLPEIDVLFSMDSSGVDTGRSGIMCLEGSSVFVSPGAGVKNAPGVGLFCLDSSLAVANGSIFTESGGTGIASWRGSVIQADGADVSNGLTYGVSASQARIVFRDGIANDLGRHAIRADEGGVVSCANASAQRASVRAVYAWRGSTVFAENVNASDAGSSAFVAINGSTVVCRGGVGDNAGVSAVFAREGSTIDAGRDFADVDPFSGINASADAVFCGEGSKVCVRAGLFSGANIGLKVEDSGLVDASGADFSSSVSHSVSVNGAATVELSGANLSNSGGHAIVAQNSPVINAEQADGSGATSNGCYALYGANISARNADFQKGASPSTSDYVVEGGGIIYAFGSPSGSANQTANSLTSDGIIFR